MYRFLLLGALAGCAPEVTSETITAGSACVDAGRTEVTFSFETCLSSSCDALISATCAAEVVGEDLVVTADAVVERTAGDCTADCGLVSATCAVPALPDTGEIVVVVGDTRTPLAEATCS